MRLSAQRPTPSPRSTLAESAVRRQTEAARVSSPQGEVETAGLQLSVARAERLGHDFAHLPTHTPAAEPRRPNPTGLPDGLKAGIEALSGMSLDSVKVHYNSSRPARLNARAFAAGREIHVAPGQERHLPHEAWHVVQQAEGRVAPTIQKKGEVPINDDGGLEQEADLMGKKALATAARSGLSAQEGMSLPVRSLGAGGPQVAQLNGDGKKPWFSGLGSLFRRHVYGPHDYDTRHTVSTANTPELEQQAVDDLHRRPTSGWRSSTPVSQEGSYRAAVPVGVVKSKALDEGVQNETTPFHVLHPTPFVTGDSPNTVRRTVERDDSGIHIRTRGKGTGLFPSVNEGLAPHFWGIPSSLTRRRFNPVLGRNWNPLRSAPRSRFLGTKGALGLAALGIGAEAYRRSRSDSSRPGEKEEELK